jgi:hypothetical protein
MSIYLLNDNSIEKKIHVYLNSDVALPYETEEYIDNIEYYTKIYAIHFQISNIKYHLRLIEYDNEIMKY